MDSLNLSISSLSSLLDVEPVPESLVVFGFIPEFRASVAVLISESISN